jgi:hypothetical protein
LGDALNVLEDKNPVIEVQKTDFTWAGEQGVRSGWSGDGVPIAPFCQRKGSSLDATNQNPRERAWLVSVKILNARREGSRALRKKPDDTQRQWKADTQ